MILFLRCTFMVCREPDPIPFDKTESGTNLRSCCQLYEKIRIQKIQTVALLSWSTQASFALHGILKVVFILFVQFWVCLEKRKPGIPSFLLSWRSLCSFPRKYQWWLLWLLHLQYSLLYSFGNLDTLSLVAGIFLITPWKCFEVDNPTIIFEIVIQFGNQKITSTSLQNQNEQTESHCYALEI